MRDLQDWRVSPPETQWQDGDCTNRETIKATMAVINDILTRTFPANPIGVLNVMDAVADALWDELATYYYEQVQED